MCDEITYEDLYIASLDGMDDITYDDLNPDVCVNVVLGLML